VVRADQPRPRKVKVNPCCGTRKRERRSDEEAHVPEDPINIMKGTLAASDDRLFGAWSQHPSGYCTSKSTGSAALCATL